MHIDGSLCPVIYVLVCAPKLFSYQKRNEAPLFGFPLEAAVDVRAVAYQDHNASLYSIKVLLQELKDKHHCQGKVSELK